MLVFTDFSDEVRQGFGSLPDFIPKDGSDKHETMFERYKRLEQEISELLADMEHLKTVQNDFIKMIYPYFLI